MPLTPDKLSDFVVLTQDNFKRKKWVDLSLDKQHYVFAQRFLKGKAREPFQGGGNLSWRVQTSNTGTAKWSELYSVDATAVKDLMVEAKAPFCKSTVNWSYDVDEDSFQSDRETIIREIDIRRHSAFSDWFELMEEALWTAPTSSTESPRTPFGIPFWVQKSATTPGGGFTGGDPSGFSSGAAGISVSDVSAWKNYSFNYTSAGSRDDLVAKMRKAIAHCYFQAPKQFAELAGGKADSDWAFYTTYSVIADLEKLLESRNDNLGTDLMKYAGSVVIRGNPVYWVPYLDSNDSSNPIYGINHKTLKYFFKKGRDQLWHPPITNARQHTTKSVHMDSWGQFMCLNRRRNFVGYVA
tara:strand:+ start:1066 stop:2124 length:1059 start_codon:yes stop_codon:yes gene_type:complete